MDRYVATDAGRAMRLRVAARYRSTDAGRELRRVLAGRRREAEVGGGWVDMDPWPNYCQGPFHVGDRWLDPSEKHAAFGVANPMAMVRDHEPPIDWVAKNPTYAGTRLRRPLCVSCNARKGNRPDWELVSPIVSD